MKKLVLRLAIALVVVIILAFLTVGLFMDRAVKRGVETYGPKFTKVTVKLDAVGLSLFSGSGRISGFVVGNPDGFKSASSISVGSVSLALSPGSLMSDKIVIKSIHLQAPEITYEADLTGNNLSKILANVRESTGGSGNTPAKPAAQPAASGPSKKLQVDDFLLKDAKLRVTVNLPVVGEKSETIPLPEIHLTDLGKGTDGITAAELTEKLLAVIEQEAVKAAPAVIAKLKQGGLNLGKDLNQTNLLNNATKGLGDLLKKK
jgi:uncharacterized protein involved in outer membrane biogenesis